MSFIGSRLGHLSKASLVASAKSSRHISPSRRPNLDNPADTIETNGLLTNHRTSIRECFVAVSKCYLHGFLCYLNVYESYSGFLKYQSSPSFSTKSQPSLIRSHALLWLTQPSLGI